MRNGRRTRKSTVITSCNMEKVVIRLSCSLLINLIAILTKMTVISIQQNASAPAKEWSRVAILNALMF